MADPGEVAPLEALIVAVPETVEAPLAQPTPNG